MTISADNLQQLIQTVQDDDSDRVYRYASLLRAYDPSSIPEHLQTRFAVPISSTLESTKTNMMYQVIRHAHNYFGRTYPQPLYVSTAGREAREKARAKTNYIKGLFFQNNLYKEYRLALLHALILGTGIVKVVEFNDHIEYETVLPTDLFIFQDEFLKPRTMFQQSFADRKYLEKKYGKTIPEDQATITTPGTDQVKIIEAYHLPSDPENPQDGNHIIMAGDTILVDEPYAYDRFPYAILRYQEPPIGYWGIGLGHILMPTQIQINRLIKNIDANIRLLGNVKIYLPKEAGIAPNQLNNDLRGSVVEYKGNRPPIIPIQPLVSPDILNHLGFLINQCWDLAGFNKDFVNGQIPTGVTANVALITVGDIQSAAHITFGKIIDEFFINIAELSMDAAQRITDRTGDYTVILPGTSEIERISLKEILKDEDNDVDYRVQIEATSRSRDTLSARIQLATWMLEQQLWTPQQALEVIDAGGNQQDIDLELAETRYIDSVFSDIEKGIYQSPDQYINAQNALPRAIQHLHNLRLQKADPEILALAADYIDALSAMIQPPPPPEPPPEMIPPDVIPQI